MPERVAAFTDTYLPTVNGVSYTVQTWRERWGRRGGRRAVVFPRADGYAPDGGEYPVASLPFPFYDGFRLGAPVLPGPVRDADVVHAHTPFALGWSGLRLTRASGAPLVASYHTPTAEYAEYLAPTERVAGLLREVATRYERWFYDRADAVTAPSERAREHLRETVGVSSPVRVVPNGVDVERFGPAGEDTARFRERYGLDGPLVGYTGRHGYEKRLDDLLAAADGMDVTLVFGGDGPARDELERQAANTDVDARFLGFLDREELPAFYSALDVFAFPSPIETQGLVALEAMACGTPVVGVESGALVDTIDAGETGYHFAPGDVRGFRAAIERALGERDRLSEVCLGRRETMSVERAVDDLADVYGHVAGDR